jgi:hypothetical protein
LPAAEAHVPELQDPSHWPLHAVLQQTLFTQFALIQSELMLHDRPSAIRCATQFPPMQYGVLAAQFVPGGAQLVKQSVPDALHAKPCAQGTCAGAVHFPPLQVEAAVDIPFEQLRGVHATPPAPAHPPQFFASVSVFVQVPPQIVVAGGVHPAASA